MDRPDWAPESIDINKPSAARMYDYYLGGYHNFAADREVADRAVAVMPEGPYLAQLNRGFLRRAVLYCIDNGIRQFIDIGSGIPTLGNVHEVAQVAAPDARVIYVDIDPVAVAHSRSILSGNDLAAVIQEDLRRPERLFRHPDLHRLIDLTRPVALLTVAVLHFIPDVDDPAAVLARWREQLAPGSHLVVSHATDENRPEDARKIVELYRGTANPLTMRRRAEVARLLDGWELVEPGLVWAPQWRPDSPQEVGPEPERAGIHVAVGRKT